MSNFASFIPRAWSAFLRKFSAARVGSPDRDAGHGDEILKAAYWAGAEAYRAALYSIQTAPVAVEEKRRMVDDLDQGVRDLGATLKQQTRRRLH